ncbi:MAG: flavodoxin family protein [Proteobacteria bacterium]|nr:flavodoxin family protein [Pseudomonadota bacterium]MBU1711096.1 flavodoxin family protein [Pseudomonadota bacterium]
MKVVAFNGSARKGGNTAHLLNTVLDALNKEGVETELVELAGKNLAGCIACLKCFENKDGRCGVSNDEMNSYIDKMKAADGIILGSPTYFADVSTNMKALIERCGMTSRANGDMFKRKAGAGVVAVRRCGSAHVLSSLNYFFLIGQMIVVGSSYWNMGIGGNPGDVLKDEEGIKTMKDLGVNMAWLLKKLS